MDDNINWLVTILYDDTLIRCALQVKYDDLPGDCEEYPMEPENRKTIHALLPSHVQMCGPIVAVDKIFEVHIANKENTTSKKGTNGLMGVFVTANLRWEAGGRQGWVISEDPLRILGASGTEYECDDDSPVIVLNPPKWCNRSRAMNDNIIKQCTELNESELSDKELNHGFSLLKCPFCGTEAKFAELSRWIRCQNDRCGASLIGPEYTYKSSVIAWNNRQNRKQDYNCTCPLDDEIICEHCKGQGVIAYNPNLNPNSFQGISTTRCTRCNGTGIVDEEGNNG